MSFEKERKLSKMFKNKFVTILWLSCFDKERNIAQIERIWRVKNRDIRKKMTPKFLKLLEKNGVIKIIMIKELEKKCKYGIRPNEKIRIESRIEWFVHMVMKDKTYFNKNLFFLNNMEEAEIVEVLKSKAFRKGCMNLQILIEELKAYSTLISEAFFNYDKDMQKNEIIKSEIKNHPYKIMITPFRTIINRIQTLSLLKAIDSDERLRDYFKGEHVHIFPSMEGLLHVKGNCPPLGLFHIYDFIKQEKFYLPEKIGKYTTYEETLKWLTEPLKYHKEDCPSEMYQDIKEMMKDFLSKDN